MRPFDDLDLVVAPDDRAQSSAALYDLGYEQLVTDIASDGSARAPAGMNQFATSSVDGRYQVWAEPGSYVVSVVGAEGADPTELTLEAGEQAEDIDFAARPIEPPDEL